MEVEGEAGAKDVDSGTFSLQSELGAVGTGRLTKQTVTKVPQSRVA